MDAGSGRVIVGYDGSEASAAAVDWAAAEALRRGDGLTVVHVASEVPVIPGRLPERLDPAARGAERVTAAGAERAAAVGKERGGDLDVLTETHAARVVPTLIAASEGADLLVVGRRGDSEIAAVVLGSVAFAVTAQARCPVVVVAAGQPVPPGEGRRVVVGIDRWPGSRAALRFAADVASSTRSPLLVVSAYRSVLDVDPAGPGTSGSDLELESDGEPHFDKQAREAAREAAGAAAAEARELYVGLEVAAQVVEGRPAQALVRQADGAALLVVGTPASGGFAGLQLGSVPHAVLHASPVPVAVVPSGDRS